MSIRVEILNIPEPKPSVVVGGIPDSGPVAGFLMEYLLKKLQAKPLANIYSWFLPSEILLKNQKPELKRYQLSYAIGADTNLLLFTGDVQPTSEEGVYHICDNVLKLANQFRAHTVYTVGAYLVRETPHLPRLFAAATDSDHLTQLKQLGALPMRPGTVTWMNGVLFGLARVRAMRGAYLCSETTSPSLDPAAIRATKSVLRFLNKVAHLSVDFDDLEESPENVRTSLEEVVPSRISDADNVVEHRYHV